MKKFSRVLYVLIAAFSLSACSSAAKKPVVSLAADQKLVGIERNGVNEYRGIPYGVALAAGAFLLLPSTEVFRLAAGA